MQQQTCVQRQNNLQQSSKKFRADQKNAFFFFAVVGTVLLAARLLPVPQNGALVGWPTLCPFKFFTGWPCPGCGLTRSLVLCAHGDWAGAFIFHPLGAVFYFGLWGALVLGVLAMLRCRRVNFRKPNSQRALMIASGTYAAAMIIVWLIRLSGILPYPPHF